MKEKIIDLVLILLLILGFNAIKDSYQNGGEKIGAWTPKIVYYLPTPDPAIDFWCKAHKDE